MTVDGTIIAIFGAPPDDLDLATDTSSAYNIACGVFFVVAVACVILRFFVRIRSSNLWWDDYTIVGGLIFSAALVGTSVFAGQHAGGQHIWTTTLPEFVLLLKVVYVEPYIYGCAVSITKISVLLLYRRLFYTGITSVSRLYWITFWFATLLASIYPLILLIIMALICRPASFFWRQYEGDTDGTCIDYLAWFVIYGGINLLNDIVILLVPIPGILQLQLSWRKKISVAGIMLLGSFVCVASSFRIYFLKQLEHSVDASWWMGPGMAWSSLEPSAAIISACLPTFASLFRKGRVMNTVAGGGARTFVVRSASRSLPLHYGGGGGGGGGGVLGSALGKANYARAWHTPASVPGRYTRGKSAFEEVVDVVELAGPGESPPGRRSGKRLGVGGGEAPAGKLKSRIVVDTEILVHEEERSP